MFRGSSARIPCSSTNGFRAGPRMGRRAHARSQRGFGVAAWTGAWPVRRPPLSADSGRRRHLPASARTSRLVSSLAVVAPAGHPDFCEIHNEIIALRILRGDFLDRVSYPEARWPARDGPESTPLARRRGRASSASRCVSGGVTATAGKSVFCASCSACCVDHHDADAAIHRAARICLVEQHRRRQSHHARDAFGWRPADSIERRAALARSVDRSQFV